MYLVLEISIYYSTYSHNLHGIKRPDQSDHLLPLPFLRLLNRVPHTTFPACLLLTDRSISLPFYLRVAVPPEPDLLRSTFLQVSRRHLDPIMYGDPSSIATIAATAYMGVGRHYRQG